MDLLEVAQQKFDRQIVKAPRYMRNLKSSQYLKVDTKESQEQTKSAEQNYRTSQQLIQHGDRGDHAKPSEVKGTKALSYHWYSHYEYNKYFLETIQGNGD